MKPSQNPPSENSLPPLVAFGAHPDDVEFACGGVLALETRIGRPVHIVVCSRGEASTKGSPEQRTAEAEAGAKILGATLEFLTLDGDAHLEHRAEHAIKLARVLRTIKPSIILAPSTVSDQHPDHAALGELVRQAARLARYGGVHELKDLGPHAINQLLFYALSPAAEPIGTGRILVDVSAPEILDAWTRAMNAHGTQTAHLNYVELQLSRARMLGLTAGIGHAIPLFPNDAVVVNSLDPVARGARTF
ncbi:MAG: PIG-L family deacetylase [Phycisphaerales bacterium]|nr:PIG-L family deacetylase [Phycisphaerales bacterium]